MLLEHGTLLYGFCMDALVIVRMLLEHERNYGLGWMSWSAHALQTRTELWFGHGCSGHRMLLEHERNYGLGMDARVIVRSWNTNGIVVLAWTLWSSYAFGTRTELWFWHGCSGHSCQFWACLIWSSYALGARTELWFGHGCSGHHMLWNTSGIMVLAWMLR